jgi:hypothetical protein
VEELDGWATTPTMILFEEAMQIADVVAQPTMILFEEAMHLSLD